MKDLAGAWVGTFALLTFLHAPAHAEALTPEMLNQCLIIQPVDGGGFALEPQEGAECVGPEGAPVLILRNHYTCQNEPTCPGDVNGNGTIDIGDVTWLANNIDKTCEELGEIP